MVVFDPSDVAGLDAAETIAELGGVRRMQRLWQAREVALLAHYADVTAHVETAVDLPTARVLHGDRMVAGGSDGTPAVAEFASLEIAALWNEGVEGVDGRIHQALDLRHRFPRLWHRVMAGELASWVAAKVTTKASGLSRAAAAGLDSQLDELVGSLPVPRLLRLVDGLVLRFTPPADADAARAADGARRGVWVRQRADDRATTVAALSAVLEAADADAVEQQVRRLAHVLARGGDARGLDERRAAALGLLAFPARALQLLQASILDQLPTDVAESWGPCPAAGQAGHLCGQVSVDPDRLLPRAELVVHLSVPVDSADSAPSSDPEHLVGRVERLGPVFTGWLGELLGHHRIAVRPVLDIEQVAPVDSYEIPERMRRAIHDREPYDTFPGSTRRSSHGCDLDHTRPYQPGGPPGQTALDNLAPVSRRAHRAKPHGGWSVHQVAPGVLVWRSPAGYAYLVTAGRSMLIGAPHRHGRQAA